MRFADEDRAGGRNTLTRDADVDLCTPGVDFTLRDEGSIFLLTPLTPAAVEWADEHLPEDAQVFAGGIVVEHRYIGDIANAVHIDGLSVEVV